MISQPIPDATNMIKGVIRIATDSEAATGTAEDICINPKQLAGALSGLFQLVKLQFTGVTLQTTYNISHSYNTKKICPIAVRNTNTDIGVFLTNYLETTTSNLRVVAPLATITNGHIYDVICVIYP